MSKDKRDKDRESQEPIRKKDNWGGDRGREGKKQINRKHVLLSDLAGRTF